MITFALLINFILWNAHGNEANDKGVINEDGIFVISPPGQVMYPYGGAYPIVPAGYPSPARNNLMQVWRYVSIPREGQEDIPAAFNIVCYDMRMPETPQCEEHSLTIEDGEKKHKYCGTIENFKLLSDTNDVRIVLRVGSKGNAYINCSAEAVLIGPNKELIPPLKPSGPSYLEDESEEIDSDEHGGEAGDVATTCPCGWANKVRSRIVNGTETAPNEFPLIAALVDKQSLWQFCGAAIITEWHALTAAHCTVARWKEGVPMAIIVGEHDLNDDPDKGASRVIDIQVVVEHDGYKPNRFIDDIALLILRQKITFSSKVGPACLPTHQMDLVKQYVKIIGWGATSFGGAGADLLQKVDVRVVNRKECHIMYPPYVREENPTQICTYAKKKASCQGDSGGPVVWLDPDTNRYTLVGLVSFGRICADNNPSVHTDVAAYMDWIQHFVSASKPDAHMCFKQS